MSAPAYDDNWGMTCRRLLPLGALLIAVALPTAARAADRLPDLDQSQPGGLTVRTDRSGAGPRFQLGFNSSVNNLGAGPLIIDAHRASKDDPIMVADQVVQL